MPRLQVVAIFFLLVLAQTVFSQGVVYIVYGSDTSVDGGLNVGVYNTTMSPRLYTAPGSNAYRVMEQAFRDTVLDSFGNKVTFTWWMLCGNFFRLADNTDVPYANVVTMHLMRKYHGDAIEQHGDELTLHYHTWDWTDYDNDGVYWWNQTKSFMELKDDWDFTLAQLLIEENVFPVSFRSGWHYMDNEWQNELDKILPYSMHNDWPAKRLTDPEPIDNIYDWSRATSEWVPYHPAADDYQLPGNLKGWNLRSKSMGGISVAAIEQAFQRANSGIDQVMCIWDHLADANFFKYFQQAESRIRATAAKYPTVKFRYCTAIEAMQLWRGGGDTTAPNVDFTTISTGDGVRFVVETNEPIFQQQPFVAIKTLTDDFRVVAMKQYSTQRWMSIGTYREGDLVAAAVALTDTMGNQTKKHIRYLPEDIFLDNRDIQYAESAGSWQTATTATWGTDSRFADIDSGETATVSWFLPIAESRVYKIFVQMPVPSNPPDSATVSIFHNGTYGAPMTAGNLLTRSGWRYVTTQELSYGDRLILSATGSTAQAQRFTADAVRLTPIVAPQEITLSIPNTDLGLVATDDTVEIPILVQNTGILPVQIVGYSSAVGAHIGSSGISIAVQPGEKVEVPVRLQYTKPGRLVDTLRVLTEPAECLGTTVVLVVTPELGVKIADNDQPETYFETGEWEYSVATSYGKTSRISWLWKPIGAKATFLFRPKTTGMYDISILVPVTVNASNKARYVLWENGMPKDSVWVDQNEGSGSWKKILQSNLSAGSDVRIEVINLGGFTSGAVLRADAAKINLVSPSAVFGDNAELPHRFHLHQNYPNPFNPSTVIRYELPSISRVRIAVFDLLGREVARVAEGIMSAGVFETTFDVAGENATSSGIYFYRFEAMPLEGYEKPIVFTKKMLLLK